MYGGMGIGPTLFLVEDYFSDMALWQAGFHSATLLGTTITDRMVDELVSSDIDRVFLLLDADATREGIKQVAKLSGIINIKPVRLTADIKDMPAKERLNFIRSLVSKS
jgi:DNA primase